MLDLSIYPILIKGAGDLATGVALRLHRAGFPVVMTEVAAPLAVRRTVAFAQAVYAGGCQVEGVGAQRATVAEVHPLWAARTIPVLVDPTATCRAVASLLPSAPTGKMCAASTSRN